MGKTKPIVIQSVVAPGVAALGASKGALAIKLKRADGSGTAGIGVSSGSVAGVTDNDGCVVLANLDEGTRTASWDQTGYVDPDGNQAITRSETIGAGTTAQDNGAYDEAAQLKARFLDDGGAAASWYSISIVQPGMVQHNGVKVFHDPTSPGTAVPTLNTSGLFPFTSAYGYYAGGCDGNDPLSYGPQTAAKAQSWTFPRASVVNKDLTLHAVTVTVLNTSGTGVANQVVKVSAAGDPAMTGCTEKVTAKTGNGGSISVPLPYGVWTVCAQNGGKYKVSATAAVNTDDTSGTYAKANMTQSVTPSLNGTCP
jgi:hypothetical protein